MNALERTPVKTTYTFHVLWSILEEKNLLPFQIFLLQMLDKQVSQQEVINIVSTKHFAAKSS